MTDYGSSCCFSDVNFGDLFFRLQEDDSKKNDKVGSRMTVKDLWDTWGELHEKTVVDIYTSGGDLLEVNQQFDKIFSKYKKYKVYTFGCTLYNHWHKIITVEV